MVGKVTEVIPVVVSVVENPPFVIKLLLSASVNVAAVAGAVTVTLFNVLDNTTAWFKVVVPSAPPTADPMFMFVVEPLAPAVPRFTVFVFPDKVAFGE